MTVGRTSLGAAILICLMATPCSAVDGRFAPCAIQFDAAGSSLLLESRRLAGLGLYDLSEAHFDVRILDLAESKTRGESAITVLLSGDSATIKVATATSNIRAANLTKSGRVCRRPRMPPLRSWKFEVSKRQFDQLVDYLGVRLKELDQSIDFIGSQTVVMVRGVDYRTRCGVFVAGQEGMEALDALVEGLLVARELRIPEVGE